MHEFIGGTLDCDETYARVEKVLFEADGDAATARKTSDSLRAISFAMLKNGYRRGFLKMPDSCSKDTPFKACTAMCVGLDSAEAAAQGDDDEATGADALSQWEADDLLKQIGGYDALEGYHSSTRKKALREMCQGGFATIGDQLSAESPFDPSFWVIHPTIERLWMWKKLQTAPGDEDAVAKTKFRSFKDEAWPTKGAAQVVGCSGHAAHDDVPFVERDSGDKKGKVFYTNQELYDLADPTTDTGLKYMYEDFTWEHCAEAGFALR